MREDKGGSRREVYVDDAAEPERGSGVGAEGTGSSGMLARIESSWLKSERALKVWCVLTASCERFNSRIVESSARGD